ncbi:MAG: hypothetical protein JWN81_2148 [Solirubrobacterales bacterium]|nr:hypothetical protein [Solirubrobacterales bacterium]
MGAAGEAAGATASRGTDDGSPFGHVCPPLGTDPPASVEESSRAALVDPRG